MKKKNKKGFIFAFSILASFVVWTVLVRCVDVRAVGPNDSCVGFASINGFVHNLVGVHLTLYNLTDWLGLVPISFAFGFALLGLFQLIKRKGLSKVDLDLFVLGGFYIAVITAFLFFENVVVNYRPILINGVLEASYPSSTTLLTMCVMPTAAMQINSRIKNKALKVCVTTAITAFTVFMVVSRLASGVHWLSDIIGGALLSLGLIMLYRSTVNRFNAIQ